MGISTFLVATCIGDASPAITLLASRSRSGSRGRRSDEAEEANSGDEGPSGDEEPADGEDIAHSVIRCLEGGCKDIFYNTS